jgi:23S rRNA G2445 N2-methylase RlmL
MYYQPAIKSDDSHLRALPSRASRTSRGTIVHNLPDGVRVRESAGAIELLGDSCDEALEQLVKVAARRFEGQRVRLLGSRDTQDRLAEMAAKRGLEIIEERQR